MAKIYISRTVKNKKKSQHVSAKFSSKKGYTKNKKCTLSNSINVKSCSVTPVELNPEDMP